MSTIVKEEVFRELLFDQLGSYYDRAHKLFTDCGPKLSFDVTNALCGAEGDGQIERILSLLETHFAEHLVYQHPDIRGQVSNCGVNPTKQLFLHICTNVLRLKPHPWSPAKI